MRGKTLAENLTALSLVCSIWGLFGFHSGDVEQSAGSSGAAIQALIQDSAAQAGETAPQNTEAAGGAPIISASVSAAEAAKTVAEQEKPVLLAEIDLKRQTMTVRRNGETLNVWKISSGRENYETPSGNYRPQHIHTMWHSKKYDNAPMPYAVFFRGGYAIHGTTALGRLGSAASHGCVRLATENAKSFYQLVSRAGVNNTQIIIHQ